MDKINVGIMICYKSNLNRLKWLINSLLYRPIHTNFNSNSFLNISLVYNKIRYIKLSDNDELYIKLKPETINEYKPFINNEDVRKIYLFELLINKTIKLNNIINMLNNKYNENKNKKTEFDYYSNKITSYNKFLEKFSNDIYFNQINDLINMIYDDYRNESILNITKEIINNIIIKFSKKYDLVISEKILNIINDFKTISVFDRTIKYIPKRFIKLNDDYSMKIHPLDINKLFNELDMYDFNTYNFTDKELERQNWIVYNNTLCYSENIVECKECDNLKFMNLHFVEDGVGIENIDLHEYLLKIQKKCEELNINVYGYGSEQHISLMSSRNIFMKLTEYEPCLMFDDDDFIDNGFDTYYLFYNIFKQNNMNDLLYCYDFNNTQEGVSTFWNKIFFNNSHNMIQYTNTMRAEDASWYYPILSNSFSAVNKNISFKNPENNINLSPYLMSYVWPSNTNYGDKDNPTPLELKDMKNLVYNYELDFLVDIGKSCYKFKPDVIIKYVNIKGFKMYKNENEKYNFYLNRPIIPINNIKPRRFEIYNNEVYNIDKFMININDINENIIFKFNEFIKNVYNAYNKLKIDIAPYSFLFKCDKEIKNEELIEELENIKLDDVFYRYYSRAQINNLYRLYKDKKIIDNMMNEKYTNAMKIFNELYNYIVNQINKFKNEFENISNFIKIFISLVNSGINNNIKFNNYENILNDNENTYIKTISIICFVFMNIYHNDVKDTIIKSNCKLTNDELKNIFINFEGNENEGNENEGNENEGNENEGNENVIENINKYLMFPDDTFTKKHINGYDKFYNFRDKLNFKNKSNIYPNNGVLFGSNYIIFKINDIIKYIIIGLFIILVIILLVKLIVKLNTKYGKNE